MRRLAFAALALLAACSGQSGERPSLAKKGLPAPAISLPKLIGAPHPALDGWDALGGKVVVLEFWATWCEPCAEYLPELNRLAEKFRGKPVVFIHVTDESEADVRAFLELNRIDGWVAPEAGAAVFKAFRVYGRPHTVVIGRDGKVTGFPKPGELTADALTGLLAGQDAPRRKAGEGSSDGAPLAEFYIAASERHSGTAHYGPASLEADGLSLEYALEWLYGKVDRFDVSPAAAKEMAAAYDIRLRLPAARAGLREKFFLDGLEAALGLKVRRARKEAEVYALRKAPGGPLNVIKRAEYGGADMKGAVLEVKGAAFSVLASRLGETLRQPVLDETGDPGTYEYGFELDSADPEVLDARLQKRLGLSLRRVRRQISVVEIGKAADR